MCFRIGPLRAVHNPQPGHWARSDRHSLASWLLALGCECDVLAMGEPEIQVCSYFAVVYAMSSVDRAQRTRIKSQRQDFKNERRMVSASNLPREKLLFLSRRWTLR